MLQAQKVVLCFATFLIIIIVLCMQRTAAPNKLYLGCVLYHEDKVLMTNEDALPLILVDDLTGVDQVW